MGIFNRNSKAETSEKSEKSDTGSAGENEFSDNGKLETQISTHSTGSFTAEELKKNPFKDPTVHAYYKKVYEDAKYECRHLYDPDFEWTEEEEKKIIRKLDYRVTFLACFMFVALQIDRGNIKQAVSDTMLEDLGLTTQDYNYGNLVSRACFFAAELPSGIISKAIGADIWLPIQMIAWSVVATCQVALTGRSSFLATRALIAVLEGGFIPDIVLWLSYFYKSGELTKRLSMFWTSLSICEIGLALVASGLLQMRGLQGLEGWRWLFLIEGLVTLLISIAAAFLMVPSAAQTSKPWNKKGWFTEREEKIVVNRVLRDDPSKGDMHNRQAISLKNLWAAIADFDLWPVHLIGLIAFASYNTVGSYLTLMLKQLGFNTFHTNLLVIPNHIIHIITLIGVTWLSEYFDERSLVSMLAPLWQMPLMGVLAWWSGTSHNSWGTWALVTMIQGFPYVHAINVSWVSRNSNSIKSRAVSAALYNMCVQAGAMYSANIYRPDDKPEYRRGNKQLFIIGLAYWLVTGLTKLYYIFRNKQKEKKWRELSEEDKQDYILNSKDEGNIRLDFRFAH